MIKIHLHTLNYIWYVFKGEYNTWFGINHTWYGINHTWYGINHTILLISHLMHAWTENKDVGRQLTPFIQTFNKSLIETVSINLNQQK